jgi:hypothetical protein
MLTLVAIFILALTAVALAAMAAVWVCIWIVGGMIVLVTQIVERITR